MPIELVLSIALPIVVTACVVACFIMYWGKPPLCPRCGEQQKFPRKPSSYDQALKGGWDCHNCQCKMDGLGKEL